MSLRSSVHIFSSESEKIIKYITGEIDTDRKEKNIINDYFEKIQNVFDGVDVDEEPLHDRDRFFVKEVMNSYSQFVPGFVIAHDFVNRGIALNIYGDIVVFPHMVSCMSSRYFSCGDSLDGVMFHATRDMSIQLHSKVISYSLSINEKTTPECRVYFAANGTICYIRRSNNPSRNTEKNSCYLKQLWHEIDWPYIMSQTSVMSFSNAIASAFQIPVEEDLSTYVYKKTQRLYGLYSGNR